MPRTFYEYDDDGRLTSSWTESEWDDEQVSLLQAHDLIVRNTGSNGEWLPEATADGGDPTRSESGYVYQAQGPFTNWAERMRMDAYDAYKKEKGEKANLNGVYFTVEKVEY